DHARDAVRPDVRVGPGRRHRLAVGRRDVQDADVERADLLGVRAVHRPTGCATAATLQVDELVTGDLLGEPGAALAQDAPVPVEQDLGRDGQRLGERALRVVEAAGPVTVAHRLVLQRALPALVTGRAVQR